MKKYTKNNAKKNNKAFKEFLDDLVRMIVFTNINE